VFGDTGRRFGDSRGLKAYALRFVPRLGTSFDKHLIARYTAIVHDNASMEPSVFDEQTLVYLRALSAQYPTIDATLAAIANLNARLTLPKGTIHVISDIHGEFKKLIHVTNNASGSLRPLVEQTFGSRLTAGEKLDILNLIYYPRETFAHMQERLPDVHSRKQFLRRQIRLEIELFRRLARNFSLDAIQSAFPAAYKSLFRELLFASYLDRTPEYIDGMLDEFVAHGRDLWLLRLLARVIRSSLFSELIVAGDFGDRGPRIDKVIDHVMKQRHVAITWGNHDVSWMGACLGQEACIATVLRMSLRYQRLFQLEMGYGIPMAPLEKLVRSVYQDDPAECFPCLGKGIRDPLSMARMQKAMAIIQFKLEGHTIRRNTGFQLEHRNLLHRIDPAAGTVEIDGVSYTLRDRHFPTIDWNDPYALSEEEEECMAQLRTSFVQSQTLWEQMKYLESKGSMHLVRDYNLILHGCVPVNEAGEPLPMSVGGVEYRGRALFDALNASVHRAFRAKAQADLDMLWYLWCGPLSPLFGKDKIATFESALVADKATHKETKNAYFRLIHEVDFCRKILGDFGVDPEHGLIVNGHVPVQIEKGESPIKRSGQAITIDGAFSEVYGDNGYTLVLDADRTYLAQHHHFESIAEAITRGSDIIPTIQDVCVFGKPRRVADTTDGVVLRHEIAALELLLQAYEQNVLQERE
jgi:fructose-1,6-bisphosphatase-3